MKPPKNRLFAVTAALSVSLLSACGSSNPPAAEIAEEVVDAQDLPDSVKACMHDVIDNFTLTDAEKASNVGTNLDEVSEKADSGSKEEKAKAQAIIDRLQSDLTACNPAG